MFGCTQLYSFNYSDLMKPTKSDLILIISERSFWPIYRNLTSNISPGHGRINVTRLHLRNQDKNWLQHQIKDSQNVMRKRKRKKFDLLKKKNSVSNINKASSLKSRQKTWVHYYITLQGLIFYIFTTLQSNRCFPEGFYKLFF